MSKEKFYNFQKRNYQNLLQFIKYLFLKTQTQKVSPRTSDLNFFILIKNKKYIQNNQKIFHNISNFESVNLL